MRNEIKELFNKSKLYSRILSKKEVKELKEKYPDGHLPEGIRIMNDGSYSNYYYSPKFDDLTNEEREMLIQLRIYDKLSKAENHLNFFRALIVFSIFLTIILFIWALSAASH